ncbi:MAG TPA: glycosyltransferase family 39 protein, partial [Thermoanaerobaculia bacterium]|nr:glycosyltransferase family 39 protein [Thermoanaerobaculia bacterium]
MKAAAPVALIAIALAAPLAVASTWTIFSQVMDEPAHVGAGMEWLAAGTYTIEAQHPPLARIAFAVGPRLLGIPFVEGSLLGTGNRILHHGGEYRKNLAAARAGNLPFLLLAIVSVAALARRLGGPAAALAAALLFATLPPILAHAGVATTDLPLTATLAASLWAFDAWLERKSLARTILLGLAVGAALSTKLSALGYLPAAMLPLLAAWIVERRGGPREQPRARELRRDLAAVIAAAAAFLLVWGALRFSVGPLVSEESLRRADDASRSAATLRWMRANVRVPAPEFFWGVQELGEHTEVGHLAYLRGESSMHGWLSYFPIAIALKTPIPFLILSLAGFVLALARARRGEWRPLGVAAGAAAILAVAMTSSINIGIRHVLPIYPLLAVVAGWWCGAALRLGRGGEEESVAT